MQLQEKARVAAQESEYDKAADTVMMRLDADELARQQAADIARREAGKLGMQVLKHQMQVGVCGGLCGGLCVVQRAAASTSQRQLSTGLQARHHMRLIVWWPGRNGGATCMPCMRRSGWSCSGKQRWSLLPSARWWTRWSRASSRRTGWSWQHAGPSRPTPRWVANTACIFAPRSAATCCVHACCCARSPAGVHSQLPAAAGGGESGGPGSRTRRRAGDPGILEHGATGLRPSALWQLCCARPVVCTQPVARL